MAVTQDLVPWCTTASSGTRIQVAWHYFHFHLVISREGSIPGPVPAACFQSGELQAQAWGRVWQRRCLCSLGGVFPRAQIKVLDLLFLDLAMYNPACFSSSTSCEASGDPFVSAHFGLFCWNPLALPFWVLELCSSYVSVNTSFLPSMCIHMYMCLCTSSCMPL